MEDDSHHEQEQRHCTTKFEEVPAYTIVENVCSTFESRGDCMVESTKEGGRKKKRQSPSIYSKLNEGSAMKGKKARTRV